MSRDIESGPFHATKVYSAPAGLLAGAQPQINASMWLLASSSGAVTLQRLLLTTDRIVTVVPESAGADSVAQSPSGIVGVAVGSGGAGALELRNAGGALIATVPVGAPARDVFAGAGGSTFYVLNGSPRSVSVTLVDIRTRRALVTVPVPLDTVAIATDPSETDIFALEAGGNVDEILIGSGGVIGTFSVGAGQPRQLAVSPDGSRLYVLRRDGVQADVAIVPIGLHRVMRALTAPDGAVDIALSLDGADIYGIVGSMAYGSVEQFPST
jgi:DNA-binding beta-propeller fold protein YncE